MNKLYDKGDTNKKTHCSDDFTSVLDDHVRNLAEEHENEEDKEFKEENSEMNNTNESKIGRLKQKKIS